MILVNTTAHTFLSWAPNIYRVLISDGRQTPLREPRVSCLDASWDPEEPATPPKTLLRENCNIEQNYINPVVFLHGGFFLSQTQPWWWSWLNYKATHPLSSDGRTCWRCQGLPIYWLPQLTTSQPSLPTVSDSQRVALGCRPLRLDPLSLSNNQAGDLWRYEKTFGRTGPEMQALSSTSSRSAWSVLNTTTLTTFISTLIYNLKQQKTNCFFLAAATSFFILKHMSISSSTWFLLPWINTGLLHLQLQDETFCSSSMHCRSKS